MDEEALRKEKIREQAKASLAKRLRAITEGDKSTTAAAESEDSQDEDIEEKLGRAAAPMAEGALMSIFKKEPAKPEVHTAGDAHETASGSVHAGMPVRPRGLGAPRRDIRRR